MGTNKSVTKRSQGFKVTSYKNPCASLYLNLESDGRPISGECGNKIMPRAGKKHNLVWTYKKNSLLRH